MNRIHASITALLLVWATFSGCKSGHESLAGAAGAAGEPNFSLGFGGEAGGQAEGGAGGDDGIRTDDKQCKLEGLDGCGVTSVAATYTTANVLLVIDKSGSMTDQPEGFGIDKWSALQNALEQALTDVAEEMNFGLLLYPYSTTMELPEDCEVDCCEVPTGLEAVTVPIEAGSSAVPKILKAVSRTAPGGGTPTAAALARALQYFTSSAGAALVGDKYVLLATDGGPNCNVDNTCDGEHCTTNLDGACTELNCCEEDSLRCLDDAAVVEQITALSDAGVPTFVVGIPGTDPYASYLDGFALAGGVPNTTGSTDYYAVSATDGVQSLAATFTDITTHLVRSCEIDLKDMPPEDRLINVAVDCAVIPYEDGAGWELDPTDRTKLELKGPTCEAVQQQGARRIDVVYGCAMVR